MRQWTKPSAEAILANIESLRVIIGLRLPRLVARDAAPAQVESRRMITEKVAAAAQAAIALAAGKSPHSIVRHYRTIIRANQRHWDCGCDVCDSATKRRTFERIQKDMRVRSKLENWLPE